MSYLRYFFLLLLCSGWVHAQEETPSREDFAWGLDLNLSGGSAFYRMPVPEAVYGGVTRRDMGDLRVFNGPGEVVPHELQLPSLRQAMASAPQSVKLFPLYGTQTTHIQTLSLHLRKRSNDGLMTLGSRQRVPKKDEVLHGYLIQLWESSPHPDAKHLQLNWKTSAQGFIYRLKVELSDDLEHWHVHNSRAVVTDLRFNGEHLQQDTIKLQNVKARYVRLTPVAGSEPIRLTAAWMTPVNQSQMAPLQFTPIDSMESGDEEGSLLFELAGPLPGAQLEVTPRERNTFVRATLYSRGDNKEPWQQRAAGPIYQLMAEDVLLQQTLLSLNQQSDRYWKLVADSSGGGFGSEAPKLRWAWTPHSLLFSARGEAPFVLAYGSARVGPAASTNLYAFTQGQARHLVSEQVQFGPNKELGGSQVLLNVIEHDWKRWSLWGALILFALLLAGLTWSVFRQMSTANKE